MSEIAELSQSLAKLLPEVGRDDFCRFLVDTIKGLVSVDEVSVIVYESASMPVFEFADPEPTAQPNLDVFLKGAFLLDPYYIAATKQEKSGFFRLRELAPTAFQESEYYKIYYQQSGLCDECGYLVSLQDQGFVNIELGRIRSGVFADEQLQLLRDISPLIDVLCNAHWEKKQNRGGIESNLRSRLEAALASFGESILTRRECQVVNLILVGHSTKTLANVLNISPETVKLHRKHSYAKLGIGTQSELFYLFIDSLMSIDSYDTGDPLTTYFQNPQK